MRQIVSIKDTRDNLADLISAVEMNGEEIIITKFGKPRAKLVPIFETSTLQTNALDDVFGIWAKRKDIDDSASWVKTQRAKISLRQRD